MTQTTTDGKREVLAPPSYPPNTRTSGIRSVFLAPDEEVRWTWAHYPDGSRNVVGYIIKKKTRHLEVGGTILEAHEEVVGGETVRA